MYLSLTKTKFQKEEVGYEEELLASDVVVGGLAGGATEVIYSNLKGYREPYDTVTTLKIEKYKEPDLPHGRKTLSYYGRRQSNFLPFEVPLLCAAGQIPQLYINCRKMRWRYRFGQWYAPAMWPRWKGHLLHAQPVGQAATSTDR